jgi:hypothetical protein
VTAEADARKMPKSGQENPVRMQENPGREVRPPSQGLEWKPGPGPPGSSGCQDPDTCQPFLSQRFGETKSLMGQLGSSLLAGLTLCFVPRVHRT